MVQFVTLFMYPSSASSVCHVVTLFMYPSSVSVEPPTDTGLQEVLKRS